MYGTEVDVVVALSAFLAMLVVCGAMAVRQWWRWRKLEGTRGA